MTDLIAELAEVVRLQRLVDTTYGCECESAKEDRDYAAIDLIRTHHATLTRILTDDAAIRSAHHDLVIRLGELTEKLEAAKRDAERYRFIRSSDADADQPYVARHGQTDWGKFYDQWLMEDDADNAIDAAMHDSAREDGNE